jgi:hypothetical protein
MQPAASRVLFLSPGPSVGQATAYGFLDDACRSEKPAHDPPPLRRGLAGAGATNATSNATSHIPTTSTGAGTGIGAGAGADTGAGIPEEAATSTFALLPVATHLLERNLCFDSSHASRPLGAR